MTAKGTVLAGLIGASLGMDRASRLFGHWLRKYSIRGQYVPLEVAQNDLAEVLRALPKMGFAGATIAPPHKARALAIADRVTDRAALIGAVNTVVFREDGQIFADNTEGFGFLETLRHGAPGWTPDAGPAVIFGAGAAARAAVAALLDAGARDIRIANRTRARAEALRTEFGAHIHVHDWVQAGNMVDGARALINCSALGMDDKPELKVPLDALTADCVVMDMVMSQTETRFLRDARAIGCPTVDGLGMFIYQAVPAFERWFGKRPEVDEAVRRAVLD